MTTVHRVYNFSSGPAVLPVPVLEEIQRDLMALPSVGMSILEISHRSKTFEDILARADADIRALAAVPSNYRVLFLQGGASLQFSMVPMNLLGSGSTADYIDTGSWAEKAINEAKKALADAATTLLHGAEAAKQASETSRQTFEEGAIAENLPSVEIARAELEAGIGVLAGFVKAGLVASNGEARRQIKGGGLRVNDATVSDEKMMLKLADLTPEGVIKLSVGKKRHILLRPA